MIAQDFINDTRNKIAVKRRKAFWVKVAGYVARVIALAFVIREICNVLKPCIHAPSRDVAGLTLCETACIQALEFGHLVPCVPPFLHLSSFTGWPAERKIGNSRTEDTEITEEI
jgi:hypothetical protein